VDYPSYIVSSLLDADILRWLAEDVATGDVTTNATIPVDTLATATFLVKQPGVIAGVEVVRRVFAAVDSSVEVNFNVSDGSSVDAQTTVGEVKGAARSILVAERLALNILQRMSGTATATRHMVEAARPFGTGILDTRKTVPGLRHLDKWAVLLGGGINHRIGLYDMILIKDNHIAASGGIHCAIERAVEYRNRNRHELKIEVETRTLDEVREALSHEALDRILLDNMVRVVDDAVNVDLLAEAVLLVDKRVQTEASGNVTLATVPAIAATGVDFISTGAFTHSVSALDISLKVLLKV
jgi:nicotinate-nucleotide pyrophosphorylase (carboxylating)